MTPLPKVTLDFKSKREMLKSKATKNIGNHYFPDLAIKIIQNINKGKAQNKLIIRLR